MSGALIKHLAFRNRKPGIKPRLLSRTINKTRQSAMVSAGSASGL